MPLYRQIALRPGAYETAHGRQLRLTANDLARCRENTLQLLARGWRVPVFIGHVEFASRAGGPRLEEPRTHARWLGRAPSSTAVGRLVDITIEPDGSLAQVIQIKRQYLPRLRRQRLRHTSPEIRPAFAAGPGEVLGPIIAHVALTRHPLCRGQSPLALVAVAAAAALAIDDSENPLSQGPDMNADELPTTPAVEEAAPETLPAEGEPLAPEAPESDVSEAETLATDAAETAPATPAADRLTLAERIRRSRKLPRGLRERLCALVETLQLSADAPHEPVVPIAEAVEMIEAAVPEHLQLADDELEEPHHPHGEDFFRRHSSQLSDDEADRIAAEQLAASGFGPAK